nr:MAG TPA: hypothetical protein [Caudoviricetes sp.]
MNKKPYSDRRWYDADFETVMNLKPLKHSEEYKKNAKEIFSGLFGREFKEDLPVELQTFEKEDTNG